MTDWKVKAVALADELEAHGHLTDPRWRRAIQEIPRHVFVPQFYDDDGKLIDSADVDQQDQQDRWLEAVYSDVSLITQRTRLPGTDIDWPTSSSSMPSLMVSMLEALSIADGHRVLEIGTGTGYNAALLLRKTSPDTVMGHVLPRPGFFMWLRARIDNPLRDGGRCTTEFNLDGAKSRLTEVHPEILDNHDFRFVLQRYIPELDSIYWARRDGAAVLELRASDASWAETIATEIEPGRYPITQGGPKPIWDNVERAAAVWNALGRPARHRFGLTATVDGAHHYWLDDEADEHIGAS